MNNKRIRDEEEEKESRVDQYVDPMVEMLADITSKFKHKTKATVLKRYSEYYKAVITVARVTESSTNVMDIMDSPDEFEKELRDDGDDDDDDETDEELKKRLEETYGECIGMDFIKEIKFTRSSYQEYYDAMLIIARECYVEEDEDHHDMWPLEHPDEFFPQEDRSVKQKTE
jgi:hypothetical protein